MAGVKSFTVFTKFAVKNNFSGPVLAMAKGADKLAAKVEAAKKTVGGIGKGFATVGKYAAVAGGAAIAAGAAVFALAKQSEEAADDIQNTANALGISTKALQEYRYVGIQAGLTTEDMDSALTKLTKNLGKGGAEVDNALYQIGVTADQLKAAGPDKSLEIIAEGFKNVKDPSVKAAVAMQLFGKSSVRMVNALESGAAGIGDLRQQAEDIGYVMGGDTLKNAGDFNDTLDKLGATTTGLINRLTAKAIPGMNKFAQSLQKSLQPGGKLDKMLEGVANMFGNVGDATAPFFDAISTHLPKLMNFIGDIAKALEPVLKPLLAMLDPIFKIIENLMPLITNVVGAISAVLAPIADLIKWILDGIATITGQTGGGAFEAKAAGVDTIGSRRTAPRNSSGYGVPMSPASSVLSSSTTSQSNVAITVGNLPPGSTVKQDKPAPGVTLATGQTVKKP